MTFQASSLVLGVGVGGQGGAGRKRGQNKMGEGPDQFGEEALCWLSQQPDSLH